MSLMLMEHKKPEGFIEGVAPVVDYYGYWPSFHDADYVAIHIDMNGPSIQIDFRLYDWNDATKIANRPTIKLLWHSVEDLTLTGIQEMGQNAIGEMQISKSDSVITTLIQTTWDGTNISFHAESVEVIHFAPNEEWDYETSNTASD